MSVNASPSFQTVRLTRGRHPGPRHGVCVAELTSMLAGERFSDHPVTACPVITAFLRGYNDNVDGRRRQDLLPLAAELVGSRAVGRTADARAESLRAFTGSLRRFPWLDISRGFEDRLLRCEALGAYVGRRARRRPDLHEQTLALVRALLGTRDPHQDLADVATTDRATPVETERDLAPV